MWKKSALIDWCRNVSTYMYIYIYICNTIHAVDLGFYENMVYMVLNQSKPSKTTFHVGSTYGIFTYMYHKNQPNVGRYTIHGWYGQEKQVAFPMPFLALTLRSWGGLLVRSSAIINWPFVWTTKKTCGAVPLWGVKLKNIIAEDITRKMKFDILQTENIENIQRLTVLCMGSHFSRIDRLIIWQDKQQSQLKKTQVHKINLFVTCYKLHQITLLPFFFIKLLLDPLALFAFLVV